jgi:hypothetical protein
VKLKITSRALRRQKGDGSRARDPERGGYRFGGWQPEAIRRMFAKGRAELSDILLLFIYLEIGAMVGIYFKTTRLPVRYLIYIAITALGRVLIEIGGAEHKTGEDLLVVAGAILVLSFAVLVLRLASHWDDPSDTPCHGRQFDRTC